MTQDEAKTLLETLMPEGFALKAVQAVECEGKSAWHITATKESKAYGVTLTGETQVDAYTLESMQEKGVETLLKTVFVGPFEDAVCQRVAEEAGVEVEALMEDLGLR